VGGRVGGCAAECGRGWEGEARWRFNYKLIELAPLKCFARKTLKRNHILESIFWRGRAWIDEKFLISVDFDSFFF
jgi:hypothetical protein